MSLITGNVGCPRGGPGACRDVGEGVVSGKHRAFGGAAPGNAIILERGQVQGCPPCLPRLSWAVRPPPAW